MRLIDADKLQDSFEHADYDIHESFAADFCEFGFSLPLVRQIIENTSTVNLHELCEARQEAPQPCSDRRKNMPVAYINEDWSTGKSVRTFSCCGKDCTNLTMWMWPKYCPWCGAKIKEKN